MFKRIKKLEETVNKLEDWAESMKTCGECGGVFDVDCVHHVLLCERKDSGVGCKYKYLYYCNAHRKPYDKIIINALGKKTFHKTDVEVTKTGKKKK